MMVNKKRLLEIGLCADLADALIEEREARDAIEFPGVTCPSGSGVLAPHQLRHTVCCALFRTPAGAVWMLRSVGHIWTQERLRTASALLSTIDAGMSTPRNTALETRLEYALELPQVQVMRPVLDGVDLSQWETRKLAVALRMQQVSSTRGDQSLEHLSKDVELIEEALLAKLRPALSRFVASLDADVLAASPRSIKDIDLYNFLCRPPHGRNRLQFAIAFPVLLRAAATGDARGLGGIIRRAVDTGLPLVRELAKHLGVTQSTLRTLVNRPVDTIGEQWESNIEALAATLNVLPAELRPDENPPSWRAFNAYVEFAQSVFGRRPWTSPLALSWLRKAASGGWTDLTIALARDDFQGDSVALVEVMRRALIWMVAAEVRRAVTVNLDEILVEARTRSCVDQYLAGATPRRMIEMARRYNRELTVARAELADEIAFVVGERFWPLIPEEYVSRDRSRTVLSLTTAAELMQHGATLDNCLGKSSLAHYAAECRRGEAFVLAIVDSNSRAPLSTAEVRVAQPDTVGRYKIRVVQHTAACNSNPQPACRTALAEVIARLRSDPYQVHLQRAVRSIASRKHAEHDRDEAERLPMAMALRRAVGDRRFDLLLREVSLSLEPLS